MHLATKSVLNTEEQLDLNRSAFVTPSEICGSRQQMLITALILLCLFHVLSLVEFRIFTHICIVADELFNTHIR